MGLDLIGKIKRIGKPKKAFGDYKPPKKPKKKKTTKRKKTSRAARPWNTLI